MGGPAVETSLEVMRGDEHCPENDDRIAKRVGRHGGRGDNAEITSNSGPSEESESRGRWGSARVDKVGG
ncbi:hypothetical protein NL676_007399 [Syzygium grande]|nr:hypothetical protein NL676_007399 [Syzygium grande]